MILPTPKHTIAHTITGDYHPALSSLTTTHLSQVLLAATLSAIAERDNVLRRRLVLMGLLWDPGRQTKVGLMSRVRSRLGLGCFGRHPERTFWRDVRFVKGVLSRAGQTLKYSRHAQQPGYYLTGQSAAPGEQARAIAGAASELDPAQIATWARLTPSARLRIANTLTRDVLSLAIQAQRRDRPELSAGEAQREVLRRHYQAASHRANLYP